MLPLSQDFAKREFHLWLHKTHNPHALAKQFPQYSLATLYRIRRDHKPKYIPGRTCLTLKGIMEFADYHKREAGRLTLEDIAVKHKLPVDTVRRLNREWMGNV